VREVPPERFAIADFYDADVSAPGKMSTRWAGLIDDIDRFDAAFFGITPREARQMDPQQRVTLELAWQAIEDAGVDPSTLRGAAVGVFVGAMWSDYARLLHRDLQTIDAYTATGQDTSIIAGRVSYMLGLSGTSLTVNTACSSSAMAVHLALQSLQAGEVQLALAAGVHLMASPESTVAMTKFGAMNPAGQCRAFDASAAGYVRGEGAGVVLLKPLARALADGDDIYCVIRGSAANNDGFSNGLTAPNPHAQQAVIRQALLNAGVEAASIDYVEAHGPGTILGDPLEASALGAVFAASRPEARALRIGSVKTNLGHLEAAAGIAGLIKLALSLRHRALVPNLHFERPNPHIAFDDLRLRVQTELESWPASRGPLRAGLSSFGFGGTNCHLVLESAPSAGAFIVALGADSREGLRTRALGALSVLSRTSSVRELSALSAQIALCTQPAAGCRSALVSDNAEELTRKLTDVVAGRSAAFVIGADAPKPRLVYLCAGDGVHWRGMARATFGTEPSFRSAFKACDVAIRKHCGWSVIDVLVDSDGRSGLAHPGLAQLVEFSIQVSLGMLWTAWGFPPDAIVGHGLGEVAACYLAGILSLSDAVRVITACALGEQPAQAGMRSLGLQPMAARVPVRSTLSEAWLEGPECGAAYWADNLRKPAQFRQAIEVVSALGPTIFLELAVQPVLDESAASASAVGTHACAILTACPRSDDERRSMLETLAELYRRGLDPCWDAILGGRDDALPSQAQSDLALHFGARPPARPGALLPFVVSAKSAEALGPQLCQVHSDLTARSSVNLVDYAGSLATTRAALEVRAVVLAAERGDVLSELERLASGQQSRTAIAGSALNDAPLALLFSGQGSQRVGMGQQLAREFAAYRVALESVLSAFEPQLEHRLRAALSGAGDGASLIETSVAQPALFALQVALYRLYESLGVRGDLLLGHSVGELAAAHVAGVMSLRDACAMVGARGRLMQALPTGGAMLALQASELELASWLEQYAGGLSLAAVNGPEAVVVSGDLAAIESVERDFRSRAREVSRLRVSHAFHSMHMEPMLEAFGDVVSRLRLAPARLPIVSSVSGQLAPAELFADPAYWVRQVREPVRFHDAVCAIRATGAGVFLELGPSAVLSQLVQAQYANVGAWPSLQADRDERETLLHALAQLHVRGRSVDFHKVLDELGARRVRVPGYAFQRERFWIDRADSVSVEPARLRAPLEGLFGLDGTAELEALGATTDSQRAALSELAPLLTAWGKAAREREALDDKRYRVEWVNVSESARPAKLAGVWLLLCGAGDAALGRSLARALETHGAQVLVRDLDDVAAFELDAQPSGIVVVTTDPAEDTDVPRGVAQLLAALQSWLGAGSPAPLWAVTRGAVSIDPRDRPPVPEQALVWGLGRVASLEHPERWGGLIDLPPDELTGTSLERFVATLARAVAEDELALRPNGLFARRLARAPRVRSLPTRLRFRGTALITGGTGALGARVARFLASRGSTHLVLTSRRGDASEGASALRTELEALGVRVTICALDVADRTALARLLATIRADGAELHTVVHAAGLNQVTPIAALTRAQLAETLHAKVLGARHLDELLNDAAPQHFVLFASGAGVWGSANQGAYAASNAYLDALAQRRVAGGRPATSIAWGIWGGGGMASDSIDSLRRRGLLALDPDLAIAALEYALAEPASNVSVADFEWRAFAAAYASARERPLLALLAPRPSDDGAVAAAQAAHKAREFVTQLRAADSNTQERLLLNMICEAASLVLGVDVRRIQPKRALKDLGMDSLMALQLRNRLAAHTGLQLAPTLLFNYPNPSVLAGYLRRQLVSEAAAGSALLVELERLDTLVPGEFEPALGLALASKLQALTSKWQLPMQRAVAATSEARAALADDLLGSIEDEQLFRLVDESIAQH
jgi:acyl transferase domain-containing protein